MTTSDIFIRTVSSRFVSESSTISRLLEVDCRLECISSAYAKITSRDMVYPSSAARYLLYIHSTSKSDGFALEDVQVLSGTMPENRRGSFTLANPRANRFTILPYCDREMILDLEKYIFSMCKCKKKKTEKKIVMIS